MPSTSLPATRPSVAVTDAAVRLRELPPGGTDAAARLAAIEQAVFSRPWSAVQMAATGDATGSLILAAEATDHGRGGAENKGTAILIVGFAIFQAVADEAELLRIAVHPSRQGQGIGRKLLAEGCRRLRWQGVRRLFLEVARDNRPAITLYRDAGFRETGVRKSYYEASGTDAVLMCRDLAKG